MKNQIYIISDSHFEHANMVKWALRPEGFSEKIWAGLDKLPDDCILIHLGDITMGGDKMVHERLAKYKFKKWLIRGNHDNHSVTWYVANGWDSVCDEMMIKMFGHNETYHFEVCPEVIGYEPAKLGNQ